MELFGSHDRGSISKEKMLPGEYVANNATRLEPG
jgi:hypothetical protein